MRRTISLSLLFTLCTLLTSYIIRLSRDLLNLEYQLSFSKSATTYLAKRTGQLTIAGLGEEFARRRLSRYGSSIDLYILVVAAAPLDYLLTQVAPSWDLVGLYPCHYKLSIPGTLGGCAPCQAHFCYQYSMRYALSAAPDFDQNSWSRWETSAGGVDFHEMAKCYKQHKISVRDAQAHCQQCHGRDPIMYTMTYQACAANVVQDIRDLNQSCSLTDVVARCADRFGMREDAQKAMSHSDKFSRRELCAHNAEEECVVYQNIIISNGGFFA